jgi:hypothetical protein
MKIRFTFLAENKEQNEQALVSPLEIGFFLSQHLTHFVRQVVSAREFFHINHIPFFKNIFG